jgi:hypothetical protein
LKVRRLCLLVVLGALAGCGSAQSTQLSQFVARASKLCPEAKAGFAGEAGPTNPAAIKEVNALVRANENLPVMRSFHAYARERMRLLDSEVALRQRLAPSVRAADPQLRELFRRQVEVYEAERRLPGIGACALSPRSNL